MMLELYHTSTMHPVQDLYGEDLDCWEASAYRVVAAAQEAAEAGGEAGNTVVIISHNAPQGLGAERHDVSGVDWVDGAGDHGDPDLRMALDQVGK
jgi:uncharacterized protein (TIGR04168 family)